MGGLPTRSNRDAFGPDYQNVRPVSDPTKEIGANIINLQMWDLAGAVQTIPKAFIKARVVGGVVSVIEQMLSFDPNSVQSLIPFVYVGAGNYTFAFDAQYPNELGNDVNTGLIGGIVSPNAQADGGSHDGGDGQAALADSSKSWTVDAFVGMTVYNLTDGSSGTISANDATTVTATLSGGTDDDWDDDDVYMILSDVAHGNVFLGSGNSGRVTILDYAGAFIDSYEFVLVLW